MHEQRDAANANPYQSPESDFEESPGVSDQRRHVVRRFRRYLPVAAAWHLVLPIGGLILDNVTTGPTWDAIRTSVGMIVSLALLVYMVRLTTMLWGNVFAIIVSLLAVFPLVGVLAVGLVAYRSGRFLREEPLGSIL